MMYVCEVQNNNNNNNNTNTNNNNDYKMFIELLLLTVTLYPRTDVRFARLSPISVSSQSAFYVTLYRAVIGPSG